MSPVKLYIIMHELTMIMLVIGITVAAIYSGKYNLCWWYLLPGLLSSMEVSSRNEKGVE